MLYITLGFLFDQGIYIYVKHEAMFTFVVFNWQIKQYLLFLFHFVILTYFQFELKSAPSGINMSGNLMNRLQCRLISREHFSNLHWEYILGIHF